MVANEKTPCAVLFDILKKHGGISNKELASLILSGRPLSDGRSPVSRVGDRTWVSRFIVHAPIGSLQERYFCDFGVSALRIVARLKSREGRTLSSDDVFDLIAGEPGRCMQNALVACHQDATVYRNMLDRLSEESGYTVDERAEIAMVLFVAAGCSGNVRKAVECTLDFSQSAYGRRPVTSPSVSSECAGASSQGSGLCLGLLRVMDGYVVGSPYWLDSSAGPVEIGAFASDGNSISSVGPDVSARHVRIWQDEEGSWFAEGLGSSNGTVLVNGASGEPVVVEPPRVEQDGFVSKPVAIRPGDELVLAKSTKFLVIEGVPEA